MKKNSTVARKRKQICSGKTLTIGMDLGDQFTYYCVLDEAGEVMVEQKLATTKQAMKQVFGRMPRSRVALETGAHSPWVSRLLTGLGQEVIVAHARNVRLIGESSRKDDRLDARMLARLARLDPRLLSPVQQRSAESQIHLTVIRARAGEILSRAAAEMRHAASEPGSGRWIKRGVKSGLGTAVGGSRIAQPADRRI